MMTSFSLLLLVTIQASFGEKANPIGKAVELLDVLKAQLQADMKADGDTYFSFAQWSTNETKTAKRITLETKQSIIDLTTSIEDEKAQREQMTRDHEKAAAELAKSEKELGDAKDVRAKDRVEYEKQEATFAESIDQLERSLQVLAKKFLDQPAVGTNLLSIATKLRSTLEEGDFKLSAQQREILDSFVHSASKHRAARGQQSMTVDFLQVRQQRNNGDDDYGEYESQSNGVVDTLEKVLEKTKASRNEANAEEVKAATAFQTLEEELVKQIQVATERMTDLQAQISQSSESQAQMEADLNAAMKLLKSTFEHLQAVNQEFTAKTRAYKERALKRSDETIAVDEAIRVLTSETAKALASRQTIGTPDFFQLARETRSKAVHVIRSAPTVGLALLALRSHTRAKSWSENGDPFDKVKSMIREMLERLTTEANEEAQHHAWCTSEMAKTTKSQDDKQNDIQKLADRLDASNNEITKLKDEIEQATSDLKDMRESLSTATRIRVEEEANAAKALKEYQDAQVLLGHALGVLKEFYHVQAHLETANKDGTAEITGENNREGLGGGVVALLEVAQADFADLEKEALAEEMKSAEMYKQMTNELQIQIATFTKDVEYKTRAKVKLEAEEARNNADKDSYDKELAAINDYLDKLKGSCIAKVEPYEERKARREQELASLKEALAFLNGEALA